MVNNKEHRKCFKCGRSSADPNIKLFRFPSPGTTNVARCEAWAYYCCPDKEWSSSEFQKKLFSEHRMLCNRHFKNTSFSEYPLSNKKLHRFAVPIREVTELTNSLVMSSKKCCVPGCLESGNTHPTLHLFPKPETRRFSQWVLSIGGDILGLSNEYIYKQRRVCHSHFEEKFCCRGYRLSNIAVPSRNLRGPVSLPIFTHTERRPLRHIQTTEPTPSTSSGFSDNAKKSTAPPTTTSHDADADADDPPTLASAEDDDVDITATIGTSPGPEDDNENGDKCEVVVENTDSKTVNVTTADSASGTADAIHKLSVTVPYTKEGPVKKPSKKVLQLRLIKEGDNDDEPIYEVVSDDEQSTKVDITTQTSAEQNILSQENHSMIIDNDVEVKTESIEQVVQCDNNKNIEYWKVKLDQILHRTDYCGICLNVDGESNGINDEFEIIGHERTHRETLRHIVDKVFKEDNYTLASAQLCKSCTKNLIQSYIFIRNAEETSKMLNYHLNDLYQKTCYIRNNNDLEDTNRTGPKIYNVVIALDKSIVENVNYNKMNTEEPKTKQKKQDFLRDRRKLKCLNCNVILPSYRAWKVHEKTTHTNDYRCSICLQNFNSLQNLTAHYRMHLKLRCKVCHRSVPDGKLLYHLKRRHKCFIHMCSTCNIAFYSVKALESHNNKCHNRGDSKCVTCLESLTEVELEKHQCRFKCPECREAPCVHHKYLMSYREQTLNLADRARCLDCSYVCTSKVALITHVNERHLNVQPYSCDRCTQKFYCRSELGNHICKSQEKSKYVHICEYCDKRYSDVYMWQRHKNNCERIQRQFQCEYCQANYDSSKDLTVHRKNRHGKDKYSCDLCDRMFLNDVKRKKHIVQAHSRHKMKGASSLDCVICRKKFTTKAALLLHLKYHRTVLNQPFSVRRSRFYSEQQYSAQNSNRLRYSICEVCGAMIRQIQLKEHMSSHSHGIVMCQTCGETFQNVTLLKYHRKRHPKNVLCPKCKKLISSAKLWRHYRNHLIQQALDLKCATVHNIAS